jgi:hypothetical protein
VELVTCRPSAATVTVNGHETQTTTSICTTQVVTHSVTFSLKKVTPR